MLHLLSMLRNLKNTAGSLDDVPGLLTVKSRNLLESMGHVSAEHECPSNDKDDCGFYRNSKAIFTLFLLHDPIVYKVISEVQDHVVDELIKQSDNAVEINQNLNKSDVHKECIAEELREIVKLITKFRTGETSMIQLSQQQRQSTAGTKHSLSIRWVEFYQAMV